MAAKNPQLGETAYPQFAQLVPDDIASQLGEARMAALFGAIRGIRKTGRVSQSVVLKLMTRLHKYPAPSVRDAVDVYLEKYAGQGYDERYLLGIVRGEAKRSEVAGRNGGSGARRPGENQRATVSKALTCVPYLDKVLGCLRQYLRANDLSAPDREQVVAVGKSVRAARDKADTGDIKPRELDTEMCRLEAELRAGQPAGAELPRFSPYG